MGLQCLVATVPDLRGASTGVGAQVPGAGAAGVALSMARQLQRRVQARLPLSSARLARLDLHDRLRDQSAAPPSTRAWEGGVLVNAGGASDAHAECGCGALRTCRFTGKVHHGSRPACRQRILAGRACSFGPALPSLGAWLSSS